MNANTTPLTLLDFDDNGGDSSGQQGHRVIPGQLDLSHKVILYLENISVSFDGFKALTISA